MEKMDHNRKILYGHLLKAVNIARVRESRLRLICDSLWCDRLKLLPIRALMCKFKFIIGNSSVRTVVKMHRIGLFNRYDELLTFAATCVRKLHGYTSSLATDLLRGMMLSIITIAHFYKLSLKIQMLTKF